MNARIVRRSVFASAARIGLAAMASASLLAGAPAHAAPAAEAAASGNIAYVIRRDAPEILSVRDFLASKGYAVTVVPLGAVLATNFGAFDMTVIADDTGNLSEWGIPPDTAAQVAKITSANKPILGIGEGGYAFFGRIPKFIGWPQGWHGPQTSLDRAPGAPGAIFSAPNVLPMGTLQLYDSASNGVGIFLPGAPGDVIPVGLETPPNNHASVVFQGCHFLWGFSDGPDKMRPEGRALFENYAQYARFFQCPSTPAPPPVDCYRIFKSATPVDGSTVTPGAIIEYVISYVINPGGSQNCPQEATLVDTIPLNTIFVPGSASDGIAPGADSSLTWPVTGSGSKTFRVEVQDTACREQLISNRAGLLFAGFLPVASNVVTHKVQCGPIRFPNDNPPYAEDEIEITPYPIIAGRPTEISVRLVNSTTTPTTVVVHFQVSPEKFGIGIPFSDIATRTVTIPANSQIVVKTTTTLFASGHYCIQIKVDIPGYGSLLTQRNLDVTEDLKPGVADALSFKVGNPLPVARDIQLVVNNTCPGFSAAVVPPLLANVGPNGSDIRAAQLIVTPPNPVTLGSGCHIDVQGWVTDPATGLPKLISGIRKLDVPPVRLPHPDIPWEEREISVRNDPPVIGAPNQICVELQNPLPVPRTVTLEYKVADFGAGIGFTLVATKTVTLPPNSIDKYCVDWTPADGTLHRCIQVTLKQPNTLDDRSQRNLAVVRPLAPQIPLLRIPVRVGNTDSFSHNLQLIPTLIGIDPTLFELDIKQANGQPVPPVINPGQVLGILIGLKPAAQNAAARGDQATAADGRVGDGSSVQVDVRFDGASIGGFTVQFDPPVAVRLPVVLREAKPL